MALLRVLALRLHVTTHDFDRAQLVGTDAAQQQFLDAGRSVPAPAPVAVHEWNRQRPAILAHQQRKILRITGHQDVAGIVGSHEVGAPPGILDRVA